MKKKYVIIITLIFMSIAFGVGLYQKHTYTNLNEEAKPLDKFIVGILPDNLIDSQIEIMVENLSQQNIIVAVKCKENSRFRPLCATQSVIVESVFRGEGLAKGDEIDLVTISMLFMDKENYVNGKPCVNLGFVNEMIPGKTYLVFLDRKIETYHEADHIYVMSESIIKPIFSYENTENIPCENEDQLGNFASYSKIKSNEFFLMSQKSIDKMQKLKKDLLEKYLNE